MFGMIAPLQPEAVCSGWYTDVSPSVQPGMTKVSSIGEDMRSSLRPLDIGQDRRQPPPLISAIASDRNQGQRINMGQSLHDDLPMLYFVGVRI
jgi:hypothetical protein